MKKTYFREGCVIHRDVPVGGILRASGVYCGHFLFGVWDFLHGEQHRARHGSVIDLSGGILSVGLWSLR